MTNFSNKIKKYTELFQEIKEDAKEQFSSLFNEFFIKYSDIKSVTFYAYSNYFSDGDSTPFYIRTYNYDVTFTNDKSRQVCEEYYDIDDDDEDIQFLEKELSFAIHDDFSAILNNIPDEIVESSFGSDVEVTVWRDGTIHSKHYGDHD